MVRSSRRVRGPDRQARHVGHLQTVTVPRSPVAPLSASIIPRRRASCRIPVAIQIPTVPYLVGPPRDVPEVEADRVAARRPPAKLVLVQVGHSLERVAMVQRVNVGQSVGHHPTGHASVRAAAGDRRALRPPAMTYVGTTLPAPAVTLSNALEDTRASVPETRPQKRYGS